VFAILASEFVRAAGGVVLRSGKVCIIHRPDYEARDLLDAVNHIMLESLS